VKFDNTSIQDPAFDLGNTAHNQNFRTPDQTESRLATIHAALNAVRCSDPRTLAKACWPTGPDGIRDHTERSATGSTHTKTTAGDRGATP
jgi:hypothetical protein